MVIAMMMETTARMCAVLVLSSNGYSSLYRLRRTMRHTGYATYKLFVSPIAVIYTARKTIRT